MRHYRGYLFVAVIVIGVLASVLTGCSFDNTGLPDGMPPAGMKRPDPKPENVTVEMIKQGVVTCTQTSFPSGACLKYVWTENPQGFADCAGDNNTYDGEMTFFQTINFVEYCIWAHPNEVTHQPINVTTMRDWDTSTLYTFRFRSRLKGGGIVYSGANFTGSFSTWLGPLNGGPADTYRELPWRVKSGGFNN